MKKLIRALILGTLTLVLCLAVGYACGSHLQAKTSSSLVAQSPPDNSALSSLQIERDRILGADERISAINCENAI